MNFNWEAFKAGKMAVTGFENEKQVAEFLQMCENKGLSWNYRYNPYEDIKKHLKTNPTNTVANPAIFPTTRQTILETAIQTVCEDRQDQYGSPEDNFGKIAELWSIYLGIDIAPKDVAMMMILLKVARSQTGEFKLDNYIDIAGYAACAGEVAGNE